MTEERESDIVGYCTVGHYYYAMHNVQTTVIVLFVYCYWFSVSTLLQFLLFCFVSIRDRSKMSRIEEVRSV